MRVLLTGGGTGGHVNPALAIADIIKQNDGGAEIAFVGTSKGIENRLVPKAGYALYHVEIQGIRRSLSLSNIKTAYLILTSRQKAKRLIEEFRPDIVIGTGGYACWPPLEAAAKLGIPTMVHESNAIPGIAVRRLQSRVDTILTNFESTAQQIKTDRRVVAVGNPIARSFGTVDKQEARQRLGIPDTVRTVILSYGGSLGATEVNRAALSLMKSFSSVRPDVMHVHATGNREYEEVKQRFDENGLGEYQNLVLQEYIYDMPLYMAAADIVICRAGAMTISEVAANGKVAIFIPSPNVTDNHQYKNAKLLYDAGASGLLEEKELIGDRLAREVAYLVDNEEQRKRMEEAVTAFAKPDVGKRIWQEITALCRKK
ncbi:MAG: undecaprenyldiphospho-muramoylpentapeptide beta-N-acetylglucosaminyltransferase [Ruminococcaceae bacterium]|nr:undecaprenyldiphospho-muramoylpentapeptide beta-N-acetylglucosaminyltransferase [Oscillospiraceae bacterium]